MIPKTMWSKTLEKICEDSQGLCHASSKGYAMIAYNDQANGRNRQRDCSKDAIRWRTSKEAPRDTHQQLTAWLLQRPLLKWASYIFKGRNIFINPNVELSGHSNNYVLAFLFIRYILCSRKLAYGQSHPSETQETKQV